MSNSTHWNHIGSQIPNALFSINFLLNCLQILYKCIIHKSWGWGEKQDESFWTETYGSRFHVKGVLQKEPRFSVQGPKQGCDVLEQQVSQKCPTAIHRKALQLPHLLSSKETLLTPEKVDLRRAFLGVRMYEWQLQSSMDNIFHGQRRGRSALRTAPVLHIPGTNHP